MMCGYNLVINCILYNTIISCYIKSSDLCKRVVYGVAGVSWYDVNASYILLIVCNCAENLAECEFITFYYFCVMIMS